MSMRRRLDSILVNALSRRMFSRTNSILSSALSDLFGRRIELGLKGVRLDSAARSPPRGQRSADAGQHGAGSTVIGPEMESFDLLVFCLDERRVGTKKLMEMMIGWG